MAVISSKERNKLKSKEFGLPKERKYPMPDKAHAINAKARATQMLKAGKLSEDKKEKIDKKANGLLGKLSNHLDKVNHHLNSLKSHFNGNQKEAPKEELKEEAVKKQRGRPRKY